MVTMRNCLSAAVFAAASLAAPAAQAAPLVAGSAALRPAVAAAPLPVETVACVRGGWRGVGVYPGCGPYRRYYRPYPYVVARPYPVAPVYVAPRVVVAGPALVPAPRQCWIAGAWRPC
jgi:hypothetical protein